jgi:hypothetical protein
MFSRIKRHFAEYERQDWEMLGYLVLIAVLILLVPMAFFWDYLQSYWFAWRFLQWKYFLTETLRIWWGWVLDKISSVW